MEALLSEPIVRMVMARDGRKGRWAVSHRLPILGRLLRTAQSSGANAVGIEMISTENSSRQRSSDRRSAAPSKFFRFAGR